MPRESAFAKGRRLLVEGRLVVRQADANQTIALVRGDSSEIYRTEWQRGVGWSCTCPVRTTKCGHLVALRLITVISEEIV